DLNVLPGLLVGCVAAHGVTVLLLRRSILTEKVARRGYHIAREYTVDPLVLRRVAEFMDTTVPTVSTNTKVSELSDRIARHDSLLTRRQATLIVDDKNKLVGIITRGDLLRTMRENFGQDMSVLEAGSSDLVVTYPDELMQDAAVKMLRNNIGRPPVVSRQ